MAPQEEDYIREFFAASGHVAAILDNYEFREVQLVIAQSILRTLSNGGFYCCEAGTGCGKTLSYLLPAVIWSINKEERVVVSTHTKNLQEQIFGKELPLIESILPDPFKYVLVKGKGNYLCLKRWREYVQQPSLSLVPGEGEIVGQLSSWVEHTTTGDLGVASPLNPRRDWELWKRICCDTYFCKDAACPDHHKCFFKKMRRKAHSANIVVVNHSLLIADRMAEGGVLGDYECLIVDESQNLVRVAREAMKFNVDRRVLLRHVRALKGVAKGDGVEGGSGRVPRGAGREIRRLSVKIEKEIERFFADSVFQPTWRPGESPALSHRSRYTSDDERLSRLKESGAPLLEELYRLLHLAQEAVEEMKREGIGEELLEVTGHIGMLEECTVELSSLLSADEGDKVYWIEIGTVGSAVKGSLNATPVDVAPYLKEILFANLRVGVFTSATLRIVDNFDFFLRSTGLDQLEDRFEGSDAFSSPFRYEEQALVAVPTFLPEPREDRYRQELVELLGQTILSLRRGTLVLFTSIRLLEYCYHRLKEGLEEDGILCLGQGIDGTREQITSRFKQERRSVLFGTDSFWEGVDIPGDALEVLIFTRLPFSVPTDPLSEAVDEMIREKGGDPFTEHFLPRAVMKFRQGFGRLIRTGRDMGIALVLDKRILHRRYGSAFLESLPIPPVEIESEEAWLPILKDWWAGRSSGTSVRTAGERELE